jgi:hypothetical protein
MGLVFSSPPIEDSEVDEEDIEGETEAEVEAERGVEAVETEPLRRARDRVIGESIIVGFSGSKEAIHQQRCPLPQRS